MRIRPFLPVLLCLAAAALPAAAQNRPGPPVNREAMWPAPTAEDWAKPVQITFQRTWEDALAVSKETKKPILICVNMDGEIASEHYAGIRYRDPEIAKLYEPYVCVIASVYRHNPRDYDDEGNRILCPRFGSVTCGEHIAIEPILYEKYFDGQRVAPRHIMVELDGTEVYDVYFRNDVASVFDDIRKGIADREIRPTPVVRGDRSLVERVASRDIVDRRAVEKAYENGDAELRSRLLDAAKKLGSDAPLDLLRLGIFGLDPDMSEKARDALAQSDSDRATDLIVDALSVPMDDAAREKLIAALSRIGESSPRARWLSVVHEGLAARTAPLDPTEWARAGAGATYEAPPGARELSEIERRRQESEDAADAAPDSPEASLDLAEASLAMAMKARRTPTEDPRLAKVVERHMFDDARRAAERAAKQGGTAWRANVVLAITEYYRGDVEKAYEYAAQAVPGMPAGDPGWNAMAVLTIFAEGRYKAIKKAARAREKWPSQWLTDLDAAYSALLHHPLATESQVAWHYDFLLWLGANRRAGNFLRALIERFPNSAELHTRLRMQILRHRGVDELERVYDEMLAGDDVAPNLYWFAGYTSVVAADYRRRRGRRDAALAAYDRAIERFGRAAEGNPDAKGTCDHWIALAYAAKSRMAYEDGRYGDSVDALLASLSASPGTAGTADDLGITPGDTARMLMAKLKEEGDSALAARLQAGMDEIDPALLAPKEE